MSDQTIRAILHWADQEGWSIDSTSKDAVQFSNSDQDVSINGSVIMEGERMLLDLDGQTQGDYRIIEVCFENRPIELLEILARVGKGSTRLDAALLEIATRFPEAYDITMDDRLRLDVAFLGNSDTR